MDGAAATGTSEGEHSQPVPVIVAAGEAMTDTVDITTMAITAGSLVGTTSMMTTMATTIPITPMTIPRRQSTATGAFITVATTVLIIVTIAKMGDGFGVLW